MTKSISIVSNLWRRDGPVALRDVADAVTRDVVEAGEPGEKEKPWHDLHHARAV